MHSRDFDQRQQLGQRGVGFPFRYVGLLHRGAVGELLLCQPGVLSRAAYVHTYAHVFRE